VIIRQDLDKAVFTLKSIVNRQSEILYIVHDQEDEWQFLSGGVASLEDMMIVSLRQIIEIDDTIQQILHLAKGKKANRTNRGSEWVIT
jgi:hypothetical protein